MPLSSIELPLSTRNLFRRGLGVGVNELLELIVQHKHNGTTRTTDDVRASALEEGTRTFLLEDLLGAVKRGRVQDIGTASLHHHATTDSVERVRDDTSSRGDDLGHQPLLPHGGVLGVRKHNITERVVTAEESSTVDNDTTNRDTETLVQALGTILLVDGADAVGKTSVHTGLALADIGGQTRTGKVKRVHEQQRGGTSSTARSEVAKEESPELVLLDAIHEELLVLVLEGEVQGLGRKVTDDIGQVTTPERVETLFLGHADEAVHDALVLVFRLDLRGSSLHLQEQLHTLDGGNDGLGDTASHTTGGQIEQEGDGASLLLGGGHGLVGRNSAHDVRLKVFLEA